MKYGGVKEGREVGGEREREDVPGIKSCNLDGPFLALPSLSAFGSDASLPGEPHVQLANLCRSHACTHF